MSELLSGKNFILFFRKRADHATSDGAKLKFQTEHSMSFGKETEATTTKDGVVNTISDGENTADITSLAYADDTQTVEVWKQLRSWFKANELIEMWQVDISSSELGTYDAEYYQGYITSFDISAPADGNVELSMSYAINGNGAEGVDTLTPEQLATVQSAQYEYETIAKTGV
ncbi:phage major tail protein, TP901-1 family [Jeotgalibaca sp. A127]|uniref:phage major tail protein, TP901-1 family n=1 Tax=Jeotgalibaca sp. A127 TaxID=3457324 RepID=UPI003FD3CFC8